MTNLKQKTREWLQSKYKAAVGNVEFWNKYSRKSIDLFGFADILAIFNHTIYAVQTTSGSNFAQHHKKIIENKNVFLWLDTDQEVWLVSWSKKKKKRGGKAYVWVPKVREYFLKDRHELGKDEEHSKLIVNQQVIVWEDKNEVKYERS